MTPGSKVRIVSHSSALPQTLIAFIGRVGVLIEWEDEIAVVKFGSRVLLVAAGHIGIVNNQEAHNDYNRG